MVSTSMMQSIPLHRLGPCKMKRALVYKSNHSPTVNAAPEHIGPFFQLTLFRDVPKSVFNRPENLFRPPDSLFDHLTVRDLIVARDVALKDGSWLFILGFIGLVGAALWAAQKSTGTLASLSVDEEDDINDAITIKRRIATERQLGLRELHNQEMLEMNNRGLYWLLVITVIAAWMAGFLGDTNLFP